ncbi:hypothetical protein P8C59_007595 [Phyllachora maydis]|uniref:Uncharacterized protein n=1 Tax=Phyllachora maydis TaxID=1825666 RepID=A0AAD9MII1_9PEZI|nr:hypothetical protein P8C59_007595 [Phyllachora maydis]
MHLLRGSCPDPGQSSRPLPPIQTLSEDKEDGEDYSKVIEVLKQHIKSHKQVITSQSSNIKTLLLSLNTLKASIKDSISTINNISSTLASLTNSSNTAATGKTSYSPRFNPFSGTIDLDSPPRPPRKKPYLGPAVNSATSNLDPPIDTGSKEGFKDTITSSIVKELSKKAYTIPDDSKLSGESNFEQWIQALSIVLRALGISNFLENTDISNTYSNSDQVLLLMLLRNSLSSSPRAAISRPIESKKEDIYNEFHALTFSTYKKGLSAFNAKFNGYLAKLTIAKIDLDPSLILNQILGLTASSLNIEYLIADILEESRNPAIEAYRAAHIANSSNSTPNSNSNPSKKGKNKKKASFILGSYNLAIEEEEEESDSSSNSILDNVLYLPNININIVSRVKHYDSGGYLIKETLYRGNRRCIAILDFKKSGFFLNVKGSSKPILHANFAFPLGLSSYTTKSIEPQRNKIVVEISSNSIRKGDYRPIIEDAIISEAIEPNKRYKLRNSPAKGTTLEGIGPSLRRKRPRRPIEPLATAQAPYQSPCKTREPKPLTGTGDLPHVLKEPVIEGNKVEKAISSPTLKEPNIGQGDYYNLLNLAKLWHVRLGHIGLRLLKKTSNLIEGDTIKIRPRPYNRNPIVLLLVNRKMELVNSTAITNKETTPFQALFNELEPGIPHIPNLERYRAIGAKGEAIIPLEKRSKSLKFISRTEECKLLAVLGSKTYLVYILSRRAVLKTSTVKFIEDNTVLSQPTDNTALEGELVDLDLDLEGAVSPDPSNLNTKKPISIEIGPSKLEPYESSSNSKLDEPLPDKPINPVIVEFTRPTISIRKPELPKAFP